MIGRYWNRLKDYLRGESQTLPGGFKEKVGIDVGIKFILHLFAKILKPMIHSWMEDYSWRRKTLKEEYYGMLEALRSSQRVRYHDALEVFITFGYLTADKDVPYYFTYKEMVHKIQEDFRPLTEVEVLFTDLKDDISPTYAEKYHDDVQEMVEKYGEVEP